MLFGCPAKKRRDILSLGIHCIALVKKIKMLIQVKIEFSLSEGLMRLNITAASGSDLNKDVNSFILVTGFSGEVVGAITHR